MSPSQKKFAVIVLAMSLCCLFGLTGCKDSKTEDAVAEAAAAKGELAKVKSDLAEIMSERDSLKMELASAKDALDKLQATLGQAVNVEEQLAALATERDAAMAKTTEARSLVEKLKAQLAEQIQKITGLEGQNKKLQEMIDELKSKLGSEVEIPSIPKF